MSNTEKRATKKKVTSTQVAKLAGVSQSAVSRTFTPGAGVSENTREKVEKAAAELGYRPNILARSLITGKSRIIGLVVAYSENQFYPKIIEKLSYGLQEHGYHLLVFVARFNDNDSTESVIDELLDHQTDGVIVASVNMTPKLTQRCIELDIPVIMFNRWQEHNYLSSVGTDSYVGGYQVGEYLAKTGHKKIAHISGWQGSSTQKAREAGFVAALESAGLKLFATACGEYHYETAQKATRQLFANKSEDERPDAVFVANDHMAFATMDVLRYELGLRVPEEVSVIGYDDAPIAAWPTYNLTTICQPAKQMAEETIKALLSRIDNPQEPAKRVVVDCHLIKRGTVKPR